MNEHEREDNEREDDTAGERHGHLNQCSKTFLYYASLENYG